MFRVSFSSIDIQVGSEKESSLLVLSLKAPHVEQELMCLKELIRSSEMEPDQHFCSTAAEMLRSLVKDDSSDHVSADRWILLDR